MLKYVRKHDVGIEVKSSFGWPWRKRAPLKVIQSHEKRTAEIQKGILYNLVKHDLKRRVEVYRVKNLDPPSPRL